MAKKTIKGASEKVVMMGYRATVREEGIPSLNLHLKLRWGRDTAGDPMASAIKRVSGKPHPGKSLLPGKLNHTARDGPVV